MPLEVGITKEDLESPDADFESINELSGMGLIIFKELHALLSPAFQKAVDAAKDAEAKKTAEDMMDQAQIGWKKLSYAIATGVVNHVRANIEVCAVRVNPAVEEDGQGEDGIQMVGTKDPASPCGVIFEEPEGRIHYVE